jgi:hypothetical protein
MVRPFATKARSHEEKQFLNFKQFLVSWCLSGNNFNALIAVLAVVLFRRLACLAVFIFRRCALAAAEQREHRLAEDQVARAML